MAAMTARSTLADLVAAQVRRAPDAVAVVDGDERLSYGELDARAERLARRLVALGVGPDVPVAILAERSRALCVALLGVLKAGGACLPLEPSHPPRRLQGMLAEAAPPVLIAQAAHAARASGFKGHVLDADAASDAGGEVGGAGVASAGPGDLAYVLYTSGSTGAPKGVMLEHRGLVNHAAAVAALYELGPADRVLQFCSIGFDVSIEETFPTWATGGTLVLRPAELPVLGRDWLAWLRRMRVTVLNLPTAYWHEWVRDLRALGERVPEDVRLVIAGGERALGSAYRGWLDVGGDRVRWLNAYGPAEASVLATYYEPPPGWPADRDPPIGRPLAGTSVHVVDERGEPVPAGTTGELRIGGVGLARGYLGRPELTEERFVTDASGARLYSTGDLVRMGADGNLEFVGRADDQVKVRGFRVECGEVEGALARHPGVAQAAVVAREDRPGERRLVGYVVPADGPAPAARDLRRFLAELLPPPLVPSAFVNVDALPLTPHGKVDRDALPPLGDPRDGRAGAGAPRTSTERAIAAIFARVLGIADVGRDDDFLELGGHSLQAVQAIAAVRQELGAELGAGDLFEAPTVAGLAAAVDATGGYRRDPAAALAPRPRRPGERIPLTLSQEHMWRLEQAADPPGLYNVTAQHSFAGTADEAALRRALADVAARHEPLRASFGVHDGTPFQRVEDSVPVALAACDVTAEELHQRLAAQDAAPFDLARAPLWRACLYRTDAGDVAAATFDHLICDGTSAYVFLSELAAAYAARAAGREPALRALPIGYGDFARWQRERVGDELLEAQVRYWRGRLAGMPLGPALPFDHVPERPSRRIAFHELSVPPTVHRAARRLARAERTTVFAVVVTAVQAVLAALGGTSDVVLSTTLSGRQRAELEGLIGCFHGVGRIRTDLSGDPPFTRALARAHESVVGLLEHQDVPFMRIRRAILPDFPAGGPALLAAVPVELQYFHTAHEEWAPGRGVVERPGPDKGPDELFFRGQMHPLAITVLDDGGRLWGQAAYKVDFYEDGTIERLARSLERLLEAVVEDPGLRLSELARSLSLRARSRTAG